MSLIKIRSGMNQHGDPQPWHESAADVLSVACICAAVCFWLWLTRGGA